MFGQSEPAYRGEMNIRQKVVVILMNVFLLGELSLSIYLGQQDQENMAAIFLTAFLPMVIFTLVLAKLFVRKLADRT